VQIVALDLFMELGASLACVAGPAAPATMHRPPVRNRFLDASVLAVITATTGQARATAVLAWLAAHTLIARAQCTQPALPRPISPGLTRLAVVAVATAIILIHVGHQLIAAGGRPLWPPALSSAGHQPRRLPSSADTARGGGLCRSNTRFSG
jgi:hypothetical protein